MDSLAPADCAGKSASATGSLAPRPADAPRCDPAHAAPPPSHVATRKAPHRNPPRSREVLDATGRKPRPFNRHYIHQHNITDATSSQKTLLGVIDFFAWNYRHEGYYEPVTAHDWELAFEVGWRGTKDALRSRVQKLLKGYWKRNHKTGERFWVPGIALGYWKRRDDGPGCAWVSAHKPDARPEDRAGLGYVVIEGASHSRELVLTDRWLKGLEAPQARKPFTASIALDRLDAVESDAEIDAAIAALQAKKLAKLSTPATAATTFPATISTPAATPPATISTPAATPPATISTPAATPPATISTPAATPPATAATTPATIPTTRPTTPATIPTTRPTTPATIPTTRPTTPATIPTTSSSSTTSATAMPATAATPRPIEEAAAKSAPVDYDAFEGFPFPDDPKPAALDIKGLRTDVLERLQKQAEKPVEPVEAVCGRRFLTASPKEIMARALEVWRDAGFSFRLDDDGTVRATALPGRTPRASRDDRAVFRMIGHLIPGHFKAAQTAAAIAPSVETGPKGKGKPAPPAQHEGQIRAILPLLVANPRPDVEICDRIADLFIKDPSVGFNDQNSEETKRVIIGWCREVWGGTKPYAALIACFDAAWRADARNRGACFVKEAETQNARLRVLAIGAKGTP